MMNEQTIGVSDDPRAARRFRQVSARELERNLPPGYVITPGGPRHRSLVHQVEPGETVVQGADGLRILRPDGTARELPEPADDANLVAYLGSGWITSAYWNNDTGSSVDSFSTTWTVPPAPADDDGQLIYLFNGMQDFGANVGIVQPVLQWGESPAGGGASWQLASWYVSKQGPTAHSKLVPVNAGDVLVGVITMTGVLRPPQSPPRFEYTCTFQGQPDTLLTVHNLVELTQCVQTLEAYRITKCSDYPDTVSTAMTAIAIRTGTTNPSMSWTAVDSVTDCNQHTIIVSNSSTNGEVDLYYANPST